MMHEVAEEELKRYFANAETTGRREDWEKVALLQAAMVDPSGKNIRPDLLKELVDILMTPR